MKKYKCTVDVPNGYFNVQGRCVKVDIVGKIGCFRISAIETNIRINRACRKICEVRQSFSSKFSGLLEGRTDTCQNDEPFRG